MCKMKHTKVLCAIGATLAIPAICALFLVVVTFIIFVLTLIGTLIPPIVGTVLVWIMIACLTLIVVVVVGVCMVDLWRGLYRSCKRYWEVGE